MSLRDQSGMERSWEAFDARLARDVREHMLRALTVELRRVYALAQLATVGHATHANLRALSRALETVLP